MNQSLNVDHLVRMFKALGEPTRLKIIKALSLQEMCVCELSEVLGMLQPRVSQHLRILKEAGLVEEERKGSFSCYSLRNRHELYKTWEALNNYLDADLAMLEGYEGIHERYQNLPYNQRVKNIKGNKQSGGGNRSV